VLNFNPTTAAELRAPTHRDGLGLIYDTPTDEFAASILTLGDDQLGHEVDAPSRHDGPQILLCTEGSTTVVGKSGTVQLARGAAAWVGADDGPIRLIAHEPTKIFRATVGL
jgi:mannose-6-phosphate isomerase